MGQFSGCGGETQWRVNNLSGSKGLKQRNKESIEWTNNDILIWGHKDEDHVITI